MNNSVIIRYFVGGVMLSLSINDFIWYAAVVECVVLIGFNMPYKSPFYYHHYYLGMIRYLLLMQ